MFVQPVEECVGQIMMLSFDWARRFLLLHVG